jgi:hypothetical protein
MLVAAAGFASPTLDIPLPQEKLVETPLTICCTVNPIFTSLQLTTLMSPEQLQAQIGTLEKPKWADLQALVELSSSTLSRSQVTSISFLGSGGYNFVYKLEFEDGSDVAASISKHADGKFNATVKLSEISTMLYLWENRELYPHVHVSRVHSCLWMS